MRIFWINLIVLVVLVMLSSCVSVRATTYTAASVAQADVQTAVNLATNLNGDVVVMPFGTASWTSTLMITNGITLMGQGTNGTIIQDSNPLTAPLNNNHCLITWITVSNTFPRLTGVQFAVGTRGSQSTDGAVRIRGFSQSFRIDNCWFNSLSNTCVVTLDSPCGVEDHNRFNTVGNTIATLIQHSAWGGVGDFGDASWNAATGLGGTNAVYLEDNTYAGVGKGSVCDAETGGRFVLRHCTITGWPITWHGTESGGRKRGTRSFEVYLNTHTRTSEPNGIGEMRSGTGVVWSNTLSGAFNVVSDPVENRDAHFFSPIWGSANGTNNWDTNGASAFFTGTASAVGYLSVGFTAPGFTVNQYVGYSAYNAASNACGVITSNSTTTLYFTADNFGGQTLTNQIGDSVSVYLVKHALDMIGSGPGDLLSGATPTAVWLNEPFEPVNWWGNTLNGTLTNMTSADPLIAENVNFTNGVKAGYTPLVYPHPLVAKNTWHVRPAVYTNFNLSSPGNPIAQAGIYGTQDGTSYDNAWNGLQSVVWGPSGVNIGDTLYIDDLHIYTMSNNNAFSLQSVVPIQQSGITIRMDYPGHPGTLFAGCLNRVSNPNNVWEGPDGNGVYWTTNNKLGSFVRPISYEITNGVVVQLLKQTNTTWTGQLGSAGLINGTNFVKTLEGTAPSTNLATAYFGWILDPNFQSNVTFQSCNFISGDFNSVGMFSYQVSQTNGGATRWSIYTNFAGPKYITLNNCTFSHGAYLQMYPGMDNWTWNGGELFDAPFGIYPIIDGQTRGPNNLVVGGMTIHDCDTTNYPNQDGHALGIQGVSNGVFTNNVIYNTGSAIEFFTGAEPMTNNLIANNFIRNTHICSVTAGGGITVSGLNATAIPGTRTGFKIFRNIIVNTAGKGIGSNNRDEMEVWGNTLFGCNNGIGATVINYPALGLYYNNIVAYPSNSYVNISGTNTTSLSIDYNLYYPSSATNNTSLFSISPAHSLGSHNLFADPKFVSTNDVTILSGFKLQAGSPAILAGTNVNSGSDYFGLPNSTDIGALVFSAPLPPGGFTARLVGPIKMTGSVVIK